MSGMDDHSPSDRLPVVRRPAGAEPELGAAWRALVAAIAILLRRWWAALLAEARAGVAAGRVRGARAAAAGRQFVRSVAAARPRPRATALRPAAPAVPTRARAVPRPAVRRSRLRPRLLVLAGAGAALLLCLLAFLGYCAYTLPLSGAQSAQLPPPAMIFENGGGKAFATRGVFKGEAISAERLPKNLVSAVIAIEDRRFFEHPGVDLWGIGRAAVRDAVAGSEREGASTITQQLVRRQYLSPERSIIRKVQEAMLAIWLEARLSKQEILARYLNTAYFGAGAYGADAAAKRYFGKDVQSLTIAEAAMLAGLIRAPTALAPTTNPEAAQRRADTVLDAMVRAGFITQGEAAQARAHPVALAVPPESEPGRNYFVDTAESEVRQLLGAPLNDLTVRTTLDPDLQTAAERIVAHYLATEGKRRHVGQAALVALAPDGKVLALVGGRDYNESQFDRATQAHRQPGSLFKVFVYLAAFGAGYTPESVLVDQPVQIGNWAPQDYGRHYRGSVTLREAFAQSINTISAQLVQAIGVQRVIDIARSLGVKSDLPAVPSLALGTAGVTLMEMTGAMNAIAVGTKKIVPYTVQTVQAHGKTPLYAHAEVRVEQPAWDRLAMMDVLQAVVKEGTGTAAQLDRPAAGKTGTSQDYRDAWFVGFTTDFVVGVWAGNDDNSPTKGVVGGDMPTKIWHDFVKEAERIKAREERTPPGARIASGTTAPPAVDGAQNASVDGAGEIAGVPLVIDTGTLLFKGRLVHLAGVDGESGHFARDMARYIGSRPVTCQPADGAGQQFRCRVGDYDLAEAVIYNGGGRAAADAPANLRSAEEKARLAERGIWAN